MRCVRRERMPGHSRLGDDVPSGRSAMTDGAGAFDAQGRLVAGGIETTVTYVRGNWLCPCM